MREEGMAMIIDVHSHLGDILNHGGGGLIEQKNVIMEKMWDPQTTNENQLNRSFGLGAVAYALTEYWATKAQRARNFTATLENMQKSLNEAAVDYTVCLPIAPYVMFDDLIRAKEKEPRILPFTSVDFTREHNITAQLEADQARGAFGLKLHPIIQSTPLNNSRTLEALQACSKLKLPVLIHGGVSNYYLGKEKKRNVPANGRIAYIEKAIRAFPSVNFIVGHAGLFQVNEVCSRLRGLANVWVDTSFQSPEIIVKLIKVFGEERVMYASDWPFGYRPPHIKTVKVACKGNRELEDRLLFKNAKKVLGLE
ncbi:MAG: amidohydrolase family protein [Chitinophagales bacterium]